MMNCLNCGANVDGLISWCDCCGAALTEPEYVCLFEHDYMDSGDITDYLTAIVARLNQTALKQVCPVVSRIELVTYCYPASLVRELRLKNGSRFSKKDGCVRVTVVFDYEAYIRKSRSEKENYVDGAIKEAILGFVRKHIVDVYDLVSDLIASV